MFLPGPFLAAAQAKACSGEYSTGHLYRCRFLHNWNTWQYTYNVYFNDIECCKTEDIERHKQVCGTCFVFHALPCSRHSGKKLLCTHYKKPINSINVSFHMLYRCTHFLPTLLKALQLAEMKRISKLVNFTGKQLYQSLKKGTTTTKMTWESKPGCLGQKQTT